MSNSLKITLIVGLLALGIGGGYYALSKNTAPASTVTETTTTGTPLLQETPASITPPTTSASHETTNPNVPHTTPTTPTPTSSPVTSTPTQSKTTHVIVSYDEPSGGSRVGFALTVDGQGIITDAETDVLATDEEAMKRQERFAQGLPVIVKGKKLSELTHIDRVGGSSLTTEAFNTALAKLKAQL